MAVRVVGPVQEADGVTVATTVVTATDDRGRDTRYLVPMASAEGRGPVADPIHSGDRTWFDALTHPATAPLALGLLSRPSSVVSHRWIDHDPLEPALARPASGDQSNTTLMVGRHVVKVIRRLEEGDNPEVAIGRALLHSRQVARLSGWSRLDLGSGPVDAVVVHRYVPGVDGFQVALQDAGRRAAGEPERHFPGAAYELGIALGAVHDELADAFGTTRRPAFAEELAARLTRRLDALDGLAPLEPYDAAARDVYAALARHDGVLPVQRIHGDLHLGQTLLTDDGWRLIDFEGEPRRPLAERSLPDTPLRDLAGVLRSFEYAARWNAAMAPPAGWAARAGEMFLEGYRLVRPDTVDPCVLDALVLDKALYEVGYESAYRPDRVRIPLATVAAVCGTG